MSKVLVLNAGSSSIKYRLFRKDDLLELVSGSISDIGKEGSTVLSHSFLHGEEKKEISRNCSIPTHREAFQKIFSVLLDPKEEGVEKSLDGHDDLFAIGHRIVHGADLFSEA